ncbi:MAG: hypothetical protein AAGH15_15815 [Myxococcota bacterium]
MKGEDDLFVRYDLDPLADATELTERFRELVRDARDEDTRAALREAWETLTLHPERRLGAALRSPPETREPPGRAPRRARPVASPAFEDALAGLGLEDLVAWPSVAAALPEAPPAPLPPLADDPVLEPGPGAGEGEAP